MKKLLFLSLALITNAAQARYDNPYGWTTEPNKQVAEEIQQSMTALGNTLSREYGHRNRQGNKAKPKKHVGKSHHSSMPKTIFRYMSPTTNEGRVTYAEKLINKYLEQSNGSLTNAQRQVVMRVLGPRTVRPKGSYRKTCGQCSCTETEITCQCLTDRGELLKSSHPIILKKGETLVNINGKLKTEIDKTSSTRNHKIPMHHKKQSLYKPVSIGMQCNRRGTIPGRSYAAYPCNKKACNTACKTLGKNWKWTTGMEEQGYNTGKITGRTCMCHYTKPHHTKKK